VGAISAVLFLGDGLLGGNRLGKALSRYLPYNDLEPGRLAIGMGVLGLVMAALNYLVALFASTDGWLFYSTFVDFFLMLLMIMLVFRYARGQLFPRRAAGEPG
jgi:intracellular septation protein A